MKLKCKKNFFKAKSQNVSRDCSGFKIASGHSERIIANDALALDLCRVYTWACAQNLSQTLWHIPFNR